MSIESFLGRERFQTPGLQKIGIGGFSLFARVSEEINLVADVPTSYVEDGSPMNDHFIRHPEQLKIEGAVGDIYKGASTITLKNTPLSNALGVITSFLPRVTSFQSVVMGGLVDTARAAFTRLNGLLAAGNQANNFLGNLDTRSKPIGEQFIDAMENIYYGNQLISVDMPYRKYDSMAITNISVKKDNTVKGGFTFTVECQRFRIAETSFAKVSAVASPAKNPATSTGGQTSGMKDVGTQAGAPRPQSFLSHYNPF